MCEELPSGSCHGYSPCKHPVSRCVGSRMVDFGAVLGNFTCKGWVTGGWTVKMAAAYNQPDGFTCEDPTDPRTATASKTQSSVPGNDYTCYYDCTQEPTAPIITSTASKTLPLTTTLSSRTSSTPFPSTEVDDDNVIDASQEGGKDSTDGSAGLSGGAVAGIVVAAMVLFGLAFAARKKSLKRDQRDLKIDPAIVPNDSPPVSWSRGQSINNAVYSDPVVFGEGVYSEAYEGTRIGQERYPDMGEPGKRRRSSELYAVPAPKILPLMKQITYELGSAGTEGSDTPYDTFGSSAGINEATYDVAGSDGVETTAVYETAIADVNSTGGESTYHMATGDGPNNADFKNNEDLYSAESTADGYFSDPTYALSSRTTGSYPLYSMPSSSDVTKHEAVYNVGNVSGMSDTEGDYALATQTSTFIETLRRPDANAQPVYDFGSKGTIQRSSGSASIILDMFGTSGSQTEEDDVIPGQIPLPPQRQTSVV